MIIKQAILRMALTMLVMAFLASSAYSSETKVQRLIKLKPNTIEKVDAKKLSRGQISLAMEFASSSFIKPSTVKLLRNATIQRVELVYTDY